MRMRMMERFLRVAKEVFAVMIAVVLMGILSEFMSLMMSLDH